VKAHYQEQKKLEGSAVREEKVQDKKEKDKDG
jgi:hypothetical protein